MQFLWSPHVALYFVLRLNSLQALIGFWQRLLGAVWIENSWKPRSSQGPLTIFSQPYFSHRRTILCHLSSALANRNYGGRNYGGRGMVVELWWLPNLCSKMNPVGQNFPHRHCVHVSGAGTLYLLMRSLRAFSTSAHDPYRVPVRDSVFESCFTGTLNWTCLGSNGGEALG